MSYIISPIIKVTEQCNFNCSFCRYSNHKQENGIISVNLVKKIMTESAEINSKSNKKVKVLFHGGEPLLWGIDNYREIIEFEKNLSKQYDVIFLNSIQTNASLIDDDWINLILINRNSRNRINIGISLDGPIGTNAHYSGDELRSFEKTIMTINKLKSSGINFGILSVITEKHIKDGAKKYYEFLLSNNIKNCGLCYCYNEDDNCSVDPERLGYYLVELFDMYFYGETRINIREFNGAIKAILTGKPNCCCHHQRERCGYFLSFLPSGDAFFCDPYNLRKNNGLGNISNSTILDLITCDTHQKLSATIRMQVDKYCKNCSVTDICGFGCPRTDIENGENYFCPTHRILYTHIAEVIKELK